MSSTAPHDKVANQLIMIGCLLLIVPCLLTIVAAAIYGWPLIWSILPQGWIPVAVAQPGESLVLVTGLKGTTGADQADQIYQALMDTSTGPNPQINTANSVRIGRLAGIPLSEQEAWNLGQEYNASLVLWGEVDASGNIEVTCSILQPGGELEPPQFTLSLASASSAAIDDLASFVLSIALYHSGNYYGADKLLGSLSGHLDPAVVTLYRIEVYRVLGNLTGALSAVDAALRGDPENASLLILRASVLYDLARYDEALKAASASLDQEPGRVESYLMRGAIYQQMGDAQSALDDINRVLERDPDNSKALRARAQAYEKLGDTQAALADYEALIQREPGNYQNPLARAQLYALRSNKDAALADFEEALRLAEQVEMPDRARQQVLEARARACRGFGEHGRALEDYDVLDSIDPSLFQHQLERGMTYWEMGDQEQAQHQWGIYMQNSGFSEDASGYNNLAWSLVTAGYSEPALDYSNHSLTLDPREPNSLHTRGYIHLQLKNYQAALDDFDKALKNGLDYQPVYRDIADAHYGLGHYEQAIENYRSYLHLVSDPADRYQVEQRLGAAQARYQP